MRVAARPIFGLRFFSAYHVTLAYLECQASSMPEIGCRVCGAQIHVVASVVEFPLLLGLRLVPRPPDSNWSECVASCALIAAYGVPTTSLFL